VNACSSNSDSTGRGQPGGTEADAGGDIYTKLGVTPPSATGDDGTPTPVPFLYESVPSPYDDGDVAACKAFTSPDAPANFHTEQRGCICDNCFDLERQCDALQGCQQIMKCILDIGCTDSNSCYLAPQKTALDPDAKGCVDVIDLWGNAGVATALSNQIGDCEKAAGCIMPAAPMAQ
jgi:hypothetical protein